MALTRNQNIACSKIGPVLAGFLPGEAGGFLSRKPCFTRVAKKVGVADFWLPGDHAKSVQALLEMTLDRKPEKFEDLVVKCVEGGIQHRKSQGMPVRFEEVVKIIAALGEIDMYPKTLNDDTLKDLPGYQPLQGALANFAASSVAPAAGHGAAQPFADPNAPSSIQAAMDALASDTPGLSPEPSMPPFTEEPSSAATSDGTVPLDPLAGLKRRLTSIGAQGDFQAQAGQYQSLLIDAFAHFGIELKSPFRVVGNQILGAFALDDAVHPLVAVWGSTGFAANFVEDFAKRIAAKSATVRGIFLALCPPQADALQALESIGERCVCLATSDDLSIVFDGFVKLEDLLRGKIGAITAMSRLYVSAKELIAD